ncbi:MAG TPA: protein translocase subunit SecD [Firmicutes bacterium]|nr:protein translocase subunit SecD [Bacillota bacterium]
MKWSNIAKLTVIVVVVALLGIGGAKPIKNNIRLGLDLRGGTHLVLNLVDTPEAKVDEQARQGVIRIINDRINQFGVTEPLIIPEGSHRVIVELPGLKDSEEAVRIIQMTAQLDFADKSGQVWLTGKDLKDARFVYDRENKPVVALEFNREGSQKFAAATEANLGQPLFILLDEQVVTAPVVKDVIHDGKAVINGIESAEEAQRYAIALRSGALPVKVDVIENRTVGPTLGQDSIEKSKRAFLIGVVAVLAFMAFYYGVFGLVADFSLAVYVFLVLSALAALHATLTLPGIAGFILSIGMAVDANVIIFERIKEERRNGKTVRSAVEAGFTRAMTTVIDSNVTTLIAAAVLYYLGTGPIRGFAVTLGVGIIASLLSAVLVTKHVLRIVVNMGLPVDIRLGGLSNKIRMDIVGKRRLWFTLSGLVIATGLVALLLHGGLNQGIEFQGGTLLQLQFEQTATLEEMRSVLADYGLEKSTLQETGDKTFLIRTKELSDETRREVLGGLEEKIGPYEVLRIEKVGAIISAELKNNAILALIVATALMLIYIAFRFEFKFAVAGVLALLHDVLLTVGIFALLKVEIDSTFVAAILTIVGYSINDTIVVFDRIRENVKNSKKESLAQIVNRSVSETLTRSINTSLTTLFAVIALLVFGGETTKVFALALFIGLVAGTYSSIFIASPLWHRWQGKA